jgi:hypothetical protein
MSTFFLRIRVNRMEPVGGSGERTVSKSHQITIPAGATTTILSALEEARERCTPCDYKAIDELVDAIVSCRGV